MDETPQTAPADIINRIGMGFTALGMSTSTMFTALAIHTGQSGPAVVFGAGVVVQTAIGLLGIRHMFRRSAQPDILKPRCAGAVARAIAAPLLFACTYAMADLPAPPPVPVPAVNLPLARP